MRLFSIYPFFMILLSLFLFACDVHEWPDETSEPPKPDHVSVELRLDFTSDRAELPDYKLSLSVRLGPRICLHMRPVTKFVFFGWGSIVFSRPSLVKRSRLVMRR